MTEDPFDKNGEDGDLKEGYAYCEGCELPKHTDGMHHIVGWGWWCEDCLMRRLKK